MDLPGLLDLAGLLLLLDLYHLAGLLLLLDLAGLLGLLDLYHLAGLLLLLGLLDLAGLLGLLDLADLLLLLGLRVAHSKLVNYYYLMLEHHLGFLEVFQPI